MSRPTAAELIERLREVHQGDGKRLSDEDLASRLPISLSTLNRWKKNDAQGFQDIVWMLSTAGWLNTGGDGRAAVEPPGDPLERIARGVTELLADQKEILSRLPPVAQPEPARSPARARTKQKRGKA